ncbi:MAG: pitrilysin family protein [Alphaproteobacteria bacterium]
MEITILKNGARIISETREGTQCVSAGVYIHTGSSFEEKKINGISHFLEHMFFKGTKTRNSIQISEEIEDVGGQLNAYTGREFTAYYAKILKEHTELAIDVIMDMLQNSVFDNEELKKEREVVIQEIKQGFDDPTDIIFDYMQEAAFTNQALGRPIAGLEKDVKSFGRETLLSYIKNNYAYENIVFAAVGNIKHSDFVKMIEDRCFSFQAKNNFVLETPKYIGGMKVEKRDIKQTHLALGFEGVNYHSEDYYTSSILSSILGGAMSSRLFVEIREKLGLAYSVYSYSTSFKDTGLFSIYAGTTKDEVKQLMPTIATEIKKIRTDLVSDKEINRAKNQLKANMLMALESSSSTLEIFARQYSLFGRRIPVEEMVAKIDNVNKEKIRSLANKIFASKPSYALLGDIGEYMDYENFYKEVNNV